MITMRETVADSMERMEPSPAEMMLRAWGERSWTSCGGWRSLFRVSEKRSERYSSAGVVLWEGDGEAGCIRRGVLALEVARASCWLPGGMRGISEIGQGGCFVAVACPGSKAGECRSRI